MIDKRSLIILVELAETVIHYSNQPLNHCGWYKDQVREAIQLGQESLARDYPAAAPKYPSTHHPSYFN